MLPPLVIAVTTTQYWSSEGTRPSTVTVVTAGSLVDCTVVVAVDDTLYLYPVTQSDDDSVQEILTDELVKVSVWIVTPSRLHTTNSAKRHTKQWHKERHNNWDEVANCMWI